MEKKYTVYAGVSCVKVTDTPKVAIRAWFSRQAKNPIDVTSCAASIEDARFLIDYAHSRKDIVEDFYQQYKTPYKLSHLLEAIDKKWNDRCDGFCGYGDQIYPFSLG